MIYQINLPKVVQKKPNKTRFRCNLLNYDSVMAWLPSQQRSLAKCGTEKSEDTLESRIAKVNGDYDHVEDVDYIVSVYVGCRVTLRVSCHCAECGGYKHYVKNVHDPIPVDVSGHRNQYASVSENVVT